MTERIQRVAAYNVCVDGQGRLLLCRLTGITQRPGWWTLPGGGIDFGEAPADAAVRELFEETGLRGRIVELLAVDSARGIVDDADYHAIRVVYRTEVQSAELVHEAEGSTDLAQWCTQDELATMPLVETA